MPDKLDTFEGEEQIEDTALSDLQGQVVELKKQISEERFFWVFVVMMLFDAIIFFHIKNWAVPVSITVLQILFLFCWGEKLGLASFVAIFHRIVDSVGRNNHK